MILKTLALSSGKVDKNEYLTGEKTLPSGPGQMIEQGKFTDTLLPNAVEKKRNAIKEHED